MTDKTLEASLTTPKKFIYNLRIFPGYFEFIFNIFNFPLMFWLQIVNIYYHPTPHQAPDNRAPCNHI